MEFFDPSEFDELKPAEIQKKGLELHQRFSQRRAYFNEIRNSPFIKQDVWHELNNVIIDFDTNSYKPWTQKWTAISRMQNANAFIKYFEEGKEIFSKIEEYISSVLQNYEHSPSIEALKEELITKIDDDINQLTIEIKSQISKGIQDLIDLKAEYKLQDTFAQSIKTHRSKSNITKNIFLFGFILSLLLIPIFILYSFSVVEFNRLSENLQWTLRITFSVTLGILSLFLFNQYRIYHIINLKFQHLYNFIGGGATFISELIGLEEASKKEVNRKLANMFIDIEDIMSTIKNHKHLTENIFDGYNKTIDSLSKNISEITKNIYKP